MELIDKAKTAYKSPSANSFETYFLLSMKVLHDVMNIENEENYKKLDKLKDEYVKSFANIYNTIYDMEKERDK